MIFSLAKDIKKNLKIYLIISDQIQFKVFMHAKVAVSDQYSIAKFLQQMQSELLQKLCTFLYGKMIHKIWQDLSQRQ